MLPGPHLVSVTYMYVDTNVYLLHDNGHVHVHNVLSSLIMAAM